MGIGPLLSDYCTNKKLLKIKSLLFLQMVASDRIELPTRGFSELKIIVHLNLNLLLSCYTVRKFNKTRKK